MSAIDERLSLDRVAQAWRRVIGSVRSATSPPPPPAADNPSAEGLPAPAAPPSPTPPPTPS